VVFNGLSQRDGPKAAGRVGGIVKTFALRSSTQKAGIWMGLLSGLRSPVSQSPDPRTSGGPSAHRIQ